MGPDSGETSIEVSSGSGFRKPGPGSSHDSSYVHECIFGNKFPLSGLVHVCPLQKISVG